jgi:hypothetical protein
MDDFSQYVENFVERPFPAVVKLSYARLVEKLTVKKTNSNNFGSALRLFRINNCQILGFPPIEHLRVNYSRGMQALYIFKLHVPHKDGYTHGLHIRLNGFVHRKTLEKFIEEIVASFAGQQLDLKAYVPVVGKSVSLFDYL